MPRRTSKASSIRRDLDAVTTATISWMRSNALRDDYGPMSQMLEHAITSVVPGSDRALLVRYGCELMGRDWQHALPGMAAFEFQNINLLVTDDVFDERTSPRMGVDPISRSWGAKPAVALGFILKSLSNESLLIGWGHTRDWNLEEAFEALEWASKWQYYSQFLEDELTATPLAEVTIESYKSLIEKATAVGIAGAIELGGVFGHCSLETKVHLRDFGMTLGCLLQVRDDCIDYIYNEELIHKGALSDLLTRRRRLPLLATYWKGNESERNRLDSLLKKRALSPDDALPVIDMLLAPKVQSFVRSFANELAERAHVQLAKLPQVGRTQGALQSLIELFRDL